MKTLIIGGGLSGLALANALEDQDSDYLLIEARARLGGRIKTIQQGENGYDMGPAWFWSGQPRIADLITRLGLDRFEQFSHGDMLFEDENGQIQRGRGQSAMQGSWRLAGGFGALIDALAARVPHDKLRLSSPVTALSHTQTGVTAQLASGETFQAEKIVLAMPPRVAAKAHFTPALPNETLHAMQDVATWMAGQAKAVFLYETPFWRDAGLSGDAMSRHGPMVEIHDASPPNGGPYALFGFIGVPPQHRRNDAALRDHLHAQVQRIFRPNAANPVALHVKDWAFDPNTATEADLAPLYAHPQYGLPQAMTELWDARLIFAGTEVAPQFGGYLEGALEAAENALAHLLAHQ